METDGSINVYLQNTKPAGDQAANWLPTPTGEFYVILRLYQPQEAVLTGQYKLPDIVHVK